MNRYTKVRELVKDPSLTIKDIAQQTGYDKGHVSRLRKASQQFECPRCGHCCQSDMPLRDYFAAKAMPLAYQYWMTDYYDPNAPDAEIRSEEIREGLSELMGLIAESAYTMADAMLKAREK